MTTPQELKDWLASLSPDTTHVAISQLGLSLIAFDQNACYTGECFEIGSSEVRDFDDPGKPHDEEDLSLWYAIKELTAIKDADFELPEGYKDRCIGLHWIWHSEEFGDEKHCTYQWDNAAAVVTHARGMMERPEVRSLRITTHSGEYKNERPIWEWSRQP